MSSYDIPDADPARSPPASTENTTSGPAFELLGANAPPLDATQRIDHLWQVHASTQEAIQLCDKKCGVLVALAGSVIAGLFSAGEAGSTTLFSRGLPGAPCGVVALTALLGAVLLAAVAIKPRLWREASQGSLFWESILQHDRPQAFAAYLRTQSQESVGDHLAHQVYTVARICRRKYVWFTWAFYLALIGGLATVAAVCSGAAQAVR